MQRLPRILVATASAAFLAACGATCTALDTQCGDAGGNYCANLDTDPLNCGTCGGACTPGLTCFNGACLLICTGDLPTCGPFGDGGPYCADLQTDSLNCGACGSACPAGQACTQGVCAPSCGTGTEPCVDAAGTTVCADLATDVFNCGACGQACAAEVACVGGVCGGTCPDGGCAVSCAPNQTLCGGLCVDLSADSFNCGGCGLTCPANQACAAGACVCAPGFSACSDPTGPTGATLCTNLVTDTQNCGTCGEACPPGAYCNNACVSVVLVSMTQPVVSGNVVTLFGDGLDPTATVDFERTPALVVGGDDTELQVVVPAGVSGEVAVTATLNGALSNTLIEQVWGTTAPVKVNRAFDGCTTATSNAGRKIATDAAGTIYIAYQCGAADAGPDLVAVSTDFGQTFHETLLPPGGYLELALQGGPAGTVYAAAFTPALGLAYFFSTDFGATWSTPTLLDSNLAPPAVVSMAYLNGTLQISASEATRIVLYSSDRPTDGLTSFVGSNSTQLGVEWFDVLLDPVAQSGYVGGDYSSLAIQPEQADQLLDAGVSYPGPGQAFYTDWALGPTDAGSVIYVGGLLSFPLAAPAAAFAILTSDLTTTYQYSGTELVDRPQSAAVAADLDGNGYLVAQSSGGIGLQQLPLNGTAASPAVTVAAAGSWPVIAPGLGQSVVVGYTDSDGGIAVSVQTFP